MITLLPVALCLLLQSTTLLGLGLIAMRLARRRGPAVQSLLGRAALAGVGLALLLAGPLTGRVRGVWHIALREPTPRQVAAPPETGGGRVRAVVRFRPLDAAAVDQAALPPAPLAEMLPVAHPTLPAASPPPPPVSGGATTYRGVGSLWASGTTLLLLWLAACQWHLFRLRRSSRPVTSGPAADTLAALTTRPPALLTHPSVRSPFLAGLRRPAIFLPPAYETDFDPAALRAILAHELAHLARCDNAWTLAARLLSALLWPQPLLWVLCRRLEQIGEEACDLAVLAQNCPPRAYAACLLALAERHPLGRRERALGAGVAPFRSSLGQRIGRILDKGTHAMSTVTSRLRLTVAVLAVAAAFGAVFLVSSAPAQSPAPAESALPPEQQRLIAMRVQDAKNLRDIGIAFTLYTQDHDEFFPDAAHWMDELSPYLKDKTVFFDPFQPDAQRYAYAFNRSCSRKALAAFARPWETVEVFDSTLNARNASDTGQSLRYNTAATGRYSNILFVDGHVKNSHGADRPSFAIKWDRRFLRMTPTHPSAGLPARLSNPPRIISQGGLITRQTFLASAIQPDPELSNARFLAGLTPVQGPGVVVTLIDSKLALPRPLPPGMMPINLIHDSDINLVVSELRAAGAEAIAVNGQRLVATSAVRCAGPTVFVNNMPQTPPFVIKAIGDSKTLASAMNLPGGVATQLRAYDPAMFSVKSVAALTLPAYSGGSEPRYAKPVSMASPESVLQQKANAGVSQALTQQRDRLRVRLDALNAEAASLDARSLMRVETQQAIKKVADRGFSGRDVSQTRGQILADQIAAARTQLDQARAAMPPRHPAVIVAERKLHSLESEDQELPILEKQRFVTRVHDSIRQQTEMIKALAGGDKPLRRQLNSVQRQQQQLRAEITMLNAEILASRVVVPAH